MIFGKKDDKGAGERAGFEVPLLPLRDIIVFPYMVVPLFVGREKSINALEQAIGSDKRILLCAQKQAKVQEPGPDDIHPIGTVGAVIQLLRLPDGTAKVLIEGKHRARVTEYLPNPDYFLVRAAKFDESVERDERIEALVRSVTETFEQYVKLNKRIPPEMVMSVNSIDDPGRLADTIVAHLSLKLDSKQAILEAINPLDRLEKLFGFMKSEIDILQVEKKIRSRVKKQMEKTQKEYYLNEQMRAIQKELGEKDEFKSEIEELEQKAKSKKLSDEARDKVEKEIKKLKMMSPMSAEATVVRNYIDWILALPWGEYTEDRLDLGEAERILDEDHYGLEKVKERILEYLAVRTLVDQMKGPILCLVGPPGVGKTSLAKSIARATGRNFVRASLGGVRDEAEIRGHRRTYIGALPGKVIQSLKKAGSNNPVFLLDEVDKMSMDFRGDPSSALLEVLDPEQNGAFNDHYLDLDYDLSKIMFITTANTLGPIPSPLLDRMEVLRIAGYTDEEKLQIARRYLVPKQVKSHGLQGAQITIPDETILEVVHRYTREAGVRNLERELATLCRKVARKVVEHGPETRWTVQVDELRDFLGVPKYRRSEAESEDRVGIATGLAWTEVGGEVLMTEVSVVPGKGKVQITGKLGDVMQESAQAAMSYVRSRGNILGLPRDFAQQVDIHIHVPDGATPKDGPSAGITLATAITSALTRTPVRSEVAMTGEITLRGRVMPIGGLKEKILAAHRAGIKTVLIPEENEKDLSDIPEQILSKIRVVKVGHVDEVLREALVLDDPEEFFRIKEEMTSFLANRVPELAEGGGEEVVTH